MFRHVWSRFQGKRSDGSLVKLRLQDAPISRKDEAAKLFTKYMVSDGLTQRAAGIQRNPKAVEEFLEVTSKMMQDTAVDTMICCEDDEGENSQIVAVSLMKLVTKAVKPYDNIELKTEEMKRLSVLQRALFEKYEPLKQLQLSRCYADIGAVVHPNFRKFGIGTEIVKARRLACLAHNVPATGALMVAIASQKAAEKEGWETVLEIDLNEFGRQHGVTYDDSGIMKFMIWKVPQSE